MMLFILLSFSFSRIYAGTEQISDIQGHWAEDDIQEWLDKGLIKGYPDHTFRPDAEISRGEFVALVNRVFKFSETAVIPFKDLPQTNWAHIEVQRAIAQGYISGFNDNTFRPAKQITRQETAVIISKLLEFAPEGASVPISAKDSNLIPAWSKSAISYLLDKGVMSTNSDGMFQPQREMTRAESIVVIKKALALSVVVYDKAGTYGESTTSTVHSDVIILSSNVTLKNMHILGDLIISKEIGDGDASLEQVQVDGVTRIEGGGMNSIHIKNSTLGTVSVNRLNQAVRIVAEGTATIQDTQILSSAIIEENGVSGDGFVDLTVLPESQVTNERRIWIAGDFNNVSVNANVSEFIVRSGTITSLFIKEKLVIPNITLNKNVIIHKLELKSKLTISGDGKIKGIVLSEEAKDSVLSKGETAIVPYLGNGAGSENPDLAVTRITAANGTVEVVFNQNLNTLPAVGDFTVLGKINNGNFQKVDVSQITLLENKTTVRLTIPSIGSGDMEQIAVYSLSYKNSGALLSEAITVPKSSVNVTGVLFHQNYSETKMTPIRNMLVYLTGVNETRGTYTSRTNESGQFAFDNVVPGTYIINIYIYYPYRYYTDEFTVESGKDLVLPDVIIKEKAPEPKVDKITYTDTAYINGSVMYLNEPFRVKVEMEDGTELKSSGGKYGPFFSLNLFDYNPKLVLKDKDKLFVTLYTDNGWTSERFEVDVAERPMTKAPVITSVVYDDTKIITGTIEDYYNDIIITREDGTLIRTSYMSQGYLFDISLSDTLTLTAGEKLLVYAQAMGKRKSDPAYIQVVAPTVVTSPPEIDGTVYGDDWHIAGKAEANSIVVVKRSDGTVVGQGKSSRQEYGSKFDIQFDIRPVAGETLYLTAKGYEKLVSKSISVIVANRPLTATPKVVGEVYSDYTYIEVSLEVSYSHSVWINLKDINGVVIDSFPTFNGKVTFRNLHLTPNEQYQLTAVEALMKESVPLIFIAKAPTAVTSLPKVTTLVYADDNSSFYGIAEPYATVYLYYEDGTLIYSNEANGLGEFSLSTPSYPKSIIPGEKLIIRADSRGKLISDALVLTATTPNEKSSQPTLADSEVYGNTRMLSGEAAKRAAIKLFYEDGRQILTGVSADMNTGQWQMGIWFTMLRGGDRIYIVSDEAGKLPSDPLYITIQPVPKADKPEITGIVSAGDTKIQGVYRGLVVSNYVPTTIFLVNENNEVYDSAQVQKDGSFSFDTHSTPLVSGQKIKMFAKEGEKEASDLLIITVN